MPNSRRLERSACASATLFIRTSRAPRNTDVTRAN
jgi:hypothetical protein